MYREKRISKTIFIGIIVLIICLPFLVLIIMNFDDIIFFLFKQQLIDFSLYMTEGPVFTRCTVSFKEISVAFGIASMM
jgi:hypothetical protein